jgi:hypothetical protein
MDVTLLKELDEVIRPTPMRPDGYGFTLDEYAEYNHCSRGAAEKVLTNLLESGVLAVTTMQMPGKSKINVYHRPRGVTAP